MKTVRDRLRDADPLGDDAGRLDQASDGIRRAVIAAASLGRPPVSRRRVVIGTAGSLAAVTVIGLFVGFGDRGTLRAAVRFEVRLAELQPAPGLIVARVGESEHLIYLHPESIVTNDDIAQSWVTQDGQDQFGISVEFLGAGAQRMRQATAVHVGRPVAILIDGRVVMAPVVRSAISNSAIITGDFSQAEAERIAAGISTRQAP